MTSEEIKFNIFNKEDVTFSLELSTTIQEIIEFLVESFNDHFQNIPIKNIIIKSQSQKILLPNQTLEQVLTQEKSKYLNVEIDYQNYPSYQTHYFGQEYEQVGFNQFSNQTQTGQSQNIQSMQSQSQEISINLVYQSNQLNCFIDSNVILEEILQDMKEHLAITENVSLFYNNNPLLNLKETLGQQNLPNNCTIHMKPYSPYGLMNQSFNSIQNPQSSQRQKQISQSADSRQKRKKLKIKAIKTQLSCTNIKSQT